MVIEMMELNTQYRIKLKGEQELFLTGKVITKTETSIKFKTIRNEEFILQDEQISWAKRNEGEY